MKMGEKCNHNFFQGCIVSSSTEVYTELATMKASTSQSAIKLSWIFEHLRGTAFPPDWRIRQQQQQQQCQLLRGSSKKVEQEQEACAGRLTMTTVFASLRLSKQMLAAESFPKRAQPRPDLQPSGHHRSNRELKSPRPERRVMQL